VSGLILGAALGEAVFRPMKLLALGPGSAEGRGGPEAPTRPGATTEPTGARRYDGHSVGHSTQRHSACQERTGWTTHPT
jgi:hypothetical protein